MAWLRVRESSVGVGDGWKGAEEVRFKGVALKSGVGSEVDLENAREEKRISNEIEFHFIFKI